MTFLLDYYLLIKIEIFKRSIGPVLYSISELLHLEAQETINMIRLKENILILLQNFSSCDLSSLRKKAT